MKDSTLFNVKANLLIITVIIYLLNLLCFNVSLANKTKLTNFHLKTITPNTLLTSTLNIQKFQLQKNFYSKTTSVILQLPTVIAIGSCMHMNDVLWKYQHDASTLPVIKAIFAIFYSLIIIFGVIGNLCVILSIARTRSLQTVPNMFIFSLSCSDIAVCCTSATITPITAFEKEWLFGQFLCSVAPFIAGVSLCFSTFTLAAISLDRFLLIRFPVKKPFSHAQAFCIIFLICILAMGLSMPIMFMQKLRPIEKYCGEFCYEDWGPHQSQRRAYGTVMLTLQFIIPLFVIVFCYTAISVRLGQSVILKSKNGLTYHWQLQMTDQQRAATKRRQRTNRMFIAMVIAFSASWVWTLLFNLFRDYDILPDFVQKQKFFFGILTHCIAMTSTVWNPLLYALLNLQLRAAFVQLMPKFLKNLLMSKVAEKDNVRRLTKTNSSAKKNVFLKNEQTNFNGFLSSVKCNTSKNNANSSSFSLPLNNNVKTQQDLNEKCSAYLLSTQNEKNKCKNF